MEAFTQMRDQKVVRFLGGAAHYRSKPIIDIINRHPFDATILALNAADTHNPTASPPTSSPWPSKSRWASLG
jgi:hypothetical protein